MNKVCTLCPNECGLDRTDALGACSSFYKPKIAKYYLHPFEEPPISGKNGSGTVFFCGCALKCVFCQNFDLSRGKRGKEITVEELADIFYELEQKGAHNINLVNPTHYVEAIRDALQLYRPRIPIVYNTHGYEKVETLKKIDDFIDVYLPDLKFYSPAVSYRYTGKKNYFDVAIKAIDFMANKPLVIEDGLMKSGTMVRHLVLPMNTADSKRIMDAFAPYKDKAYLSLMAQYTPFGEIENFEELKRKITKREYEAVLDYALSLGIENIFVQTDSSASEEYIPNWDY